MPDERELGGYTRDQNDPLKWIAPNIGTILPLIILVTVIGGYVWMLNGIAKIDADRFAFMSKCIEFKSVDRCFELDRYGRRDLAFK